tara:strand:+ start:4229 stop:4486 length:258 start_codon:yes stop_codon:yes gene_type:complete
MKKNQEPLEKVIRKLQEDDDLGQLKKWNEDIINKIVLLLPSILFLLTFLKINNDKSFIDLFNFIIFSTLLVSFGVALNYLLQRNK